MAAKNPCAKRVTPETAYEIWQSYDGSWTYFVLKKYQSPENEATNPYARWYCMVTSPATTARGDWGDVYVATVKDGACQVIHNPLALPLCFHLHAEKPSSQEGWVDCLDTSFSTLAEAQRLYQDALKTYPFVQLLIEKWQDKEIDEAPVETMCLLSHGTPPVAHSSTHTDEQTTSKEQKTLSEERSRPAMKLLTEELKRQLPPLYSQEHVEDPLVICKFFHPLSSLTWYAYEGSPVDEDGYYDTDKEKVDFVFFGWVNGDFPELGYFSLSELESVNVMGLGIERDLHFKPMRLSEVKQLHAETPPSKPPTLTIIIIDDQQEKEEGDPNGNL